MKLEIDKVYNITVFYNITKNNNIIKNATFIKDEVNQYSTTNTGSFTPEETGTYLLCGIILNSTANDTNQDNDQICKSFNVIDTSNIPNRLTA